MIKVYLDKNHMEINPIEDISAINNSVLEPIEDIKQLISRYNGTYNPLGSFHIHAPMRKDPYMIWFLVSKYKPVVSFDNDNDTVLFKLSLP